MLQRMIRFAKLASWGITGFVYLSFVSIAAAEPCVDCNNGPSLREQIKVERAREAERIAKESADRPWDGRDILRVKRPVTSAIVR
jgi:hypothetical protein